MSAFDRTPDGTAAPIRFARLRWWFARTFKTSDYQYVVNDRALPDDFDIDAVARRIIHEHRDTLRKLAEND